MLKQQFRYKAWIEPESFTINGSSCGDLFVDDVQLNLNVEVQGVFLDNYSNIDLFDRMILIPMLNEWKAELINELSSYTIDMEDKLNNDENYADLRNVYASIATARWYKESVPRQTALFGNLMDSSNLENVNINVPSNKSWWDSRSTQFLFRYTYPTFRPWECSHVMRYWE